ncbi:MAG: hypothetical protein KDN22_20960 [Verrucomicrobiae bacterium]|nr:hypothetical protein [Verrucomicrobiae bacterium]
MNRASVIFDRSNVGGDEEVSVVFEGAGCHAAPTGGKQFRAVRLPLERRR